MIPDFKTFLRESVWSDMEDRGTGISVKAEDELVELKNKLNSFYTQSEPFLKIEVDDGCLSMPLFRNKFNMISSIHIRSCEKDRDYVVFNGMNPKGYHFNKYMMPLKTDTEEIYSMFENTYKFEKEESDGMEHWIRYELRMKNGSKFTNDECFKLIENIFNIITDKKGFTRLFIPRLRESVWSDMEERGTGDKIKSEDELDNKTFDGFCKYWSQRYSLIKSSGFKSMEHIHNPRSNREQLITPIELNKESGFSYTFAISMFYNSNTDQIIDFKMDYGDLFLEYYPQLQEVLGDEYIVDDEYIRVANGDYKFHHYIDILDKCLNMVKKPSVRINESIWSDMEDRGNGDLEKKEDSIDFYDIHKFYKYIIDHFETHNIYEPNRPWNINYVADSNYISVPIIQHYNYTCYVVKLNFKGIDGEDEPYVSMNVEFEEHTPQLYKKIRQHFKTFTRQMNQIYTQLVICPPDGSEYTNTHFINVINFIIENIDDEKLLICHHK